MPHLPAGIHEMSAEAYHADPCDTPALSNSIAKILLSQSPMHAKMAHPKLNPYYVSDEDSRFDLGSAAHALLLEGSNAKLCVIDAADWRTKAAKEQRDEARANGLLPILAKHDKALNLMVTAAKSYIDNSELKGLFGEGKPEQTVIWQEGAIWCKARTDWLTSDAIILDYKTTGSAAPEACIRQIVSLGYDVQDSFYRRGVQAVTKQEPKFVFLFQEITAPYACSLVSLSNTFREIADEKVRRAIAMWQECLATNKWAGYPDRICYAEPPNWAMTEHMNLMEQEAAE